MRYRKLPRLQDQCATRLEGLHGLIRQPDPLCSPSQHFGTVGNPQKLDFSQRPFSELFGLQTSLLNSLRGLGLAIFD